MKGRTPLWLQRQRAQALLAEAHKHPRFPIVLETYRECLQDVFDLPALTEVLSGVRQRTVHVDVAHTQRAPPFSQSLVFQYVATYLYDTDAPAAERRAQALSLDRALLREILGHEDVRDLLDPDALDELEHELQRTDQEHKAHHKDALHDLLRRVGDLSLDELLARSTEDPLPWLQELEREKRAARIRVAGEERVIVAEDAARYRDALGVMLPPGLPQALLEKTDAPLEGLVRRYARTHGPFTASDVARRFGLLPAHVEPVARALVEQGVLVDGELRPGGKGQDLCDADVLRRLKRRSLAKLRAEVAPVDAETYARFLLSWQGVHAERPRQTSPSMARLDEVIAQLEGVPLAFSSLESELLPARVPGFSPQLLEKLGAMGGVVWVGRGALGTHDGRVALYRRDRAHLLLDAPPDAKDAADLTPEHRAILEHLEQRGASFLMEVQRAGNASSPQQALDLLWDLVWRGLVTNDAFQPLRGLGRRTTSRSRGAPAVGGRCSLVKDLVKGASSSSTERAHALAMSLLERWGVVSRECCAADEVPGGFSAVYTVLKALEESGHVRRGHFVDGLTGAQFAMPGVVDRLRARREASGNDEVIILSAGDPANAWGAALPWPTVSSSDGDGEASRPRRVGGALVVLVGGRPVLYVEKGGKSLVTFPAARGDGDDLARAVHALKTRLDYKTLRIARVDGADADTAPTTRLLIDAGFALEHKGIVLQKV
jgi:ATP-dependent Lhr-like helicase